MNRPTLLEGSLVALVAAVGGAAAIHTLSGMLPHGTSLGLSVAGLGLGYLVYLLGRTDTPIGRPTAIGVWFLVSTLVWALNPSLLVLVLVQVVLIWLARSLYFHDGPLGAALDAALILAGLAIAEWVGVSTGSALIALWCLFLIQGLFVLVPRREARGQGAADDGFEQARSNAERALRGLSAKGSGQSDWFRSGPRS